VIVLLETVHRDAHAILAEADEVSLVSSPPTFEPGLPRDQVRALVTRGRGQITKATFTELPNLEVVARCGAGLDNVDTAAAAAAGVSVVHAPGSTTHAVAEHALMLMLGLARRLSEADAAVKQGRWDIREGFETIELRGRRLGVLGLGAIGTQVARLGRALDMDVVGWARRDNPDQIPRLELDELLSTSDVVQVCVALNAETTGLIGEAELNSMKPGSLLINTARGPIVDHQALDGALEAGTLGGYAADVWDPEPPDPGDSVVAHPRVLITPHVAGLTDVTYREICVRTASAVAAVLTGADPDPRCVYRGAEAEL
jgi:phosphoglycerate dehydrogenase-like enzyme